MSEESQGQGSLVGFRRVDRVFLQRNRGDWVIYRMERLEDRTIETRNPDGTLQEEPAGAQ